MKVPQKSSSPKRMPSDGKKGTGTAPSMKPGNGKTAPGKK